jgi:hypothetical protein
MLPHLLEQPVVIGAMRFEIEAEVEERLPQHAVGAKIECRQQAANAAITVKERMDRLKLDVEQPGFDQGG